MKKKRSAVIEGSNMEIKGSVVIQNSEVGGSVTNQTAAPSRPEITDEAWKNLEFFLAGNTKQGVRNRIEKFRNLLQRGHYDAARVLWHEIRQDLLANMFAQPVVRIFEEFFLRG